MIKSRISGWLLGIIPQETKRRLGVLLGAPDIRWSLRQIREFGFCPSHVMDVGAFQGEWARICLDVFPDATIVCIEPQEGPQEQLKKLVNRYSNLKVIQTLLGKFECASVPFQEVGSGSSVLPHSAGETQRPMTTIDALIKGRHCESPELLKLDVQGFELEILQGYTHDFERCRVIEIEISLLPIVQGAPSLHEVVNYLHKRGFVMFDVDELIRAPSDGNVWQIDALFCRVDSPLRTKRIWRTPSGQGRA
jgi:FkbM family methyltransferase